MDPITYSIIRHRLFRITDEAVITLKHVSGSAITNEGHDLLVGLYRADGSLLMGGLGYLNHMVYAAEACKVVIRRFTGDINENDIFLLNDPYTAAAHTSDVYLISPIHHKGQLVAWSACFVHIADIGALNPGGFSPDSRDIYTEGFSSPGLKLVAGGELRQDIFDTMLNMVRSPEMVALDIRSMIACNNVAKERMLDLIAKYGYQTVDQAGGMLIAQSEAAVAVTHRGTAERKLASASVHGCGGNDLQSLPDHAERWQKLVFDFTGSSPQADRAVNCTRSACLGAVLAPLFTLVCYDAIWNEGIIRGIEVVTPDSSIVSCHASCTGIGRHDRRNSVDQDRRMRNDLEDACRQRQVPQRGNSSLACQQLCNLPIRAQSAQAKRHQHHDRNVRRRCRGQDIRGRRRHRRADYESNLAHGECGNLGEQFSDPLSISSSPNQFRRRRQISRWYRDGIGDRAARRAGRRIALRHLGQGPNTRHDRWLAGGYPGSRNRYVWVTAIPAAICRQWPGASKTWA